MRCKKLDDPDDNRNHPLPNQAIHDVKAKIASIT